MTEVKAIVLRAAGINCDMETEYALELAGAKAERVHINRMIEDKRMLDEFQIIVFPGGFSYGDDVAAGKILANQVVHHLSEAVQKFIDKGKLVLGICNGFQVLVKTGILPGNGKELGTSPSPKGPWRGDRKNTEKERLSKTDNQSLTITYNDSGKFEDRWVYLAPQSERCVFIEPGRQIYLPIAHAEGKVVTKDEATPAELKSEGRVAFKYVDKNGEEGEYPVNPNGSIESIAGLTDGTGRVLGLMPHPERFVRRTQHPRWTRGENGDDADGMTIFNNAVKYVRENL
ncbi:MAG: phosphoribosylformylglycinamidine synthase I [Phycisphaerae bacterium]|nr:phosphoribosylformylglycinamidine synthase I [Phycisphaerae bacterium]